MKLISLNTWGAKAGTENLLSFFKKHTDIDVFCLQEVWEGGHENAGKVAAGRPMTGINHAMITDIGAVLKNYAVYFRPHFKDYFGVAIFVKKALIVQEEGDIFVYKEKGYFSEGELADHARNLQYITLETNKGLRTIFNVHALWTSVGKIDTPDRLLQSDNIIQFIQSINNPFVLCGDFNLRPDTASLKKFEAGGMKNLIKEFGITSTRSTFYDKEERFADYAFVSPEITVKEFKVLPDEVSDHLALYLDFE